MGINFSEKWSWRDLEDNLNDDMLDKLKEIKSIISKDDANFLCNQITKLEKPEDIKKLSNFQNEQVTLSAWVPGFLPDQFITENHLPIPNNVHKIILLLWELTKQREKNINAIKKFEAYPLKFSHQKYEQKRKITYPDNWKFKFDLSAVKETLNFIKKSTSSFQEAMSIAKLRSNQEMLEHRKNLDYLPDPKTTTENLANLLLKAQSKLPLDLMWKWLNPMNYFDFADLFTYIKEYEELINQIEFNKGAIKEEVLGTIYKYIKLNVEIEEIFAATIGFGIRGWVTENMFGVNIEYVKDDFNLLLGTIGHELFHRLQTKICTKGDKPATFEELVTGSFVNPKDNKFYEILSYVMLEGTGEVIKYELMGETFKNLEIEAKEGIALLEQIYNEIYTNNNLEKADELLHKGLISTGPFYSLGKLITDIITDRYKESYLGEVLGEGTISFFTHFLNDETNNLNFPNHIIEKIRNLQELN